MTTREFIAAIADGTLFERDIIAFAESVSDKEALIWDLWLSDKAVWDKIGTPQITDSKQTDRVSDAIWILSQKYDINIFFKTDQEPQLITWEDDKDGLFAREKVKTAFLRATEKGLITISENGCIWNGSNVLLCYFFGRLVAGDKIEKSKVYKSDKYEYSPVKYGFPAKALEDFFGIKNLKKSRNQIKGGSPPKGWEEIEIILKDLL